MSNSSHSSGDISSQSTSDLEIPPPSYSSSPAIDSKENMAPKLTEINLQQNDRTTTISPNDVEIGHYAPKPLNPEARLSQLAFPTQPYMPASPSQKPPHTPRHYLKYRKNPPKKLTFFQKQKRNIRLFIKTFRRSKGLKFIVGLFLFSTLLGVLAYIFRRQLIPILNSFAKFVAGNGIPGALLYIFMVALTCFPPMTGYSFLLTLSGYVFGVGYGFLVNYLGALIGGVACFAFSRFLGISYVKYKVNHLPSKKPVNSRRRSSILSTTDTLISGGGDKSEIENDHEVIQMHDFVGTSQKELRRESTISSSSGDETLSADATETIDSYDTQYVQFARRLGPYLQAHPIRAWKLLILLRLAPYPYNIMSALMATIPSISFLQYTVVTAISLVKVVIHAWIGSTLGQLEDLFQNPVHSFSLSGGQIAQMVILGLAIVFAIGGGVYLYRVIQKSLDEMETDDDNENEDSNTTPPVNIEA